MDDPYTTNSCNPTAAAPMEIPVNKVARSRDRRLRKPDPSAVSNIRDRVVAKTTVAKTAATAKNADRRSGDREAMPERPITAAIGPGPTNACTAKPEARRLGSRGIRARRVVSMVSSLLPKRTGPNAQVRTKATPRIGVTMKRSASVADRIASPATMPVPMARIVKMTSPGPAEVRSTLRSSRSLRRTKSMITALSGSSRQRGC